MSKFNNRGLALAIAAALTLPATAMAATVDFVPASVNKTYASNLFQNPATSVLTPATILELQSLVERVHVEDEVLEYVVRLARATRSHGRLLLGVSPRAALALVQAARAKALLDARDYVLPDDVKQLSASVLAHRLVLTPEAEMDGTSADDILTQTLSRVSLRRG